MVGESSSGQSQAPCGPLTAGVATDAIRAMVPGIVGTAPAKADFSSAGQAGARAPEAIGLASWDRVGALFSYVVATDSGFAPNPFFGLCTLACCKPAIRRAVGARLLRESG